MLLAISPIDGRYHNKVDNLRAYFSEFGLIYYRVKVEILYIQSLAEIELPGLETFTADDIQKLEEILFNFGPEEAEKIKEIEKTTNHDVKAVEYYLKQQFDENGLGQYKEFIHFGLTSQDINNTAIPMLLRDGINNVYLPELEELIEQLNTLAEEWMQVPMLARTHGQPASPTTLGKELMVFVERLIKQAERLANHFYDGKFGGATGNFNAHVAAYPEIDWPEYADGFLMAYLELNRQQTTTQIEHYDEMASVFDNLRRIQTILIDLSRDIWGYIAFDYFKQRTVAGEVGSSAMPHKVNPIDFENAEGNLGISNAILGHLSEKLPISRFQRDLTDSTVLRNIGVPIAHGQIALLSLSKGLGKLVLNPTALFGDLEANWAVIAEGIQTILRRNGYENPYEALKTLTRGKTGITKADLMAFVDGLDVADDVKMQLRALSPHTYIGVLGLSDLEEA
jgi:adenylosuccinate lyase